MRALLAPVLAIALAALPAAAEGLAPSEGRGWQFSAESDPVDFLSHGYALYLGVKPPDTRWRYGLGTFALDFPGFLVDALAPEKGFSVRAQWTALGYASRYFSDDRRGLFVGARGFVSSFRYHFQGEPGQDDVTHAFLGPEVGYQWFPFDHGFYVTPWAGASFDLYRSSTPRVGAHELSGARVLPLLFVYFGYEFGG